VSGFIERTLDFTGHDGGTDDEQDALVAAVDACGPIYELKLDPPIERPNYRSESDNAGSLV
jgi:hypothetical protein